ncbi:unnamed protein product [Rhizoctonia solani]|uniref:DUF6533 domain-containing protein n=1 Tax=Rhizoctonia solani TaxID=456999 RepID=A0A8H3DIJ7_9AGAM|nr:unnamed protein product [Rhizoctonia solani]
MELPLEVMFWLESSLVKRDGDPIPANPMQSLIDTLEALRLAKYLIVVVFTLLMYDIVLTYSREVQLIWGSRWTFVRVLFTIARYLVPCILMCKYTPTFVLRHVDPLAQQHSCRIEMRMMAASGIFANATMMCILLLRVWALWGRKSWMLAILLLVFASSQLPPALLIGKTIQKLDVVDNPLPGLLTGCVTTASSSTSTHWVQLFISSLTYESTLFLLTITRAWSLNQRGVGTPIMTLLTRDGAWYFLVSVTIDSTSHPNELWRLGGDRYDKAFVGLTAAGTLIPKTQMAALLSQFFIAMMSCTCCRLLLRLRGFYTPTDQSTRGEEVTRSQQNEISMQRYPSGRNDHLTPVPVASNASFDHISSKLPV